MLQYIRDRATGWIAWAIILLICIPFALFGINQYFEADQGLVVAKVNDTEIGYYQYRSAFQQQRNRLEQMFGGSIPPGMMDESQLRRASLERLINDELLVQGAVSNGLRVGDEQLAAAIRSLPAFRQGGSFSQAAYEGFVRSRGTSVSGFELDMRRSLLIEQVSAALVRSEIVTRQELDTILRLRNEERRFRMLRVDPEALQVPEPDEQQIRERFEANPELYVQPERVKIRYIELSRDEIAGAVSGDEAELRSIYESSRNSFRTAEQRSARHILLNLAPDASEEEVAAARAKIEGLRQRIEGGEDFAEVAKAESQDPGSAPLGGALGFFGRGVMDPAFEDTAFSLAQGALSQPVRSRFGWHLIQVTEIQPEQVRSFEDVRAELLSEYQNRQAEQIFAEHVERLVNLGFEHPESLEVAAEALGVTPKTTDFFSRSGQGASGVAAHARVREAAFSEDVLAAGNNSEMIELGPTRVLMLRVAEREAARARTLDEVREEISAELKREAASAQAASLGEKLLQDLLAGASLEEAAGARPGLSWSPEHTARRDAPGPLSGDLVKTLFAMPVPQGERASYAGAGEPGGAYVLLALLETAQASPSAEDAARLREQLANSLQSGYGEQGFEAVMRVMRERSDVQILEQNLRPEEG